MSTHLFRTGLLMAGLWVAAAPAGAQPVQGEPAAGADGAALVVQLERAERVHRLRLGELRRIYELAREHTPGQVSRVLKVASAEQDRHQRETAVLRARLGEAQLAQLDERLDHGRRRTKAPVLPEELVRRKDRPRKPVETDKPKRPLTRRQQAYSEKKKREVELQKMRAGAKERDKQRRQEERSTRPLPKDPGGKKIKSGRKKRKGGLNGGNP